MIVEEGGQFPKSVNDLRKVKGIGEYTAGAVASIAFNEVTSFCSHGQQKSVIVFLSLNVPVV